MNENLPNLQEWATSLIGRDWEIYWKPENPAEDQQNENEDEDEDMEDVEDWYDGHIVDIDYRKEDGNFSFRVTFVGDDTVYKMVLEPTWVRPAARAWITRSKAILTYQSTRLKQPTSTEEWDKSLPSDTSTLEDKETLAQMETQQEEDAPLTAGDALQAQVSKGQNFPSNEEVSEVRRLLTVLKKQIYLRSRLAPIVEHPGDGGPSEVYVDHLFQCLKYLESACQWYLECWNLHKRVFFPCPASSSTGSSNQQSAKLNEDFTIQEGLQKGRHAVIQVLKADTSLAAAKRRRQPEHSPTMGRRKTKRRRKNKSFQEIVKENERGGEQPNPQEDEFLSVEVVNDFVEQLWSQDNRWYLRNFGKMLLSLSLNIVTPLLSWRRRVEALLGDRSVVDANTSDSATTSEEEEDIDAVEKHGEEGSLPQDAASSVHGKRYYTYDEIKSFEESANGDQVLRHFDLAMWQDRLRQKASDVEKFENHAWEVLSQLFGKPAMMGGDAKEADEIYSQLLKLRSDATTCDSPVANVSPLGNVTSMLTRKVIDDSIAIRSWYLDLKRVEASKERLVFIDQMVSRAAELPRMPPCVHSASLDSLFDEAVARLKNISQKYFDHMPRFDKYKSLLLARSSASNDDGLDFLSKEGVSRALQELGDIRVLSLAEEMLSVRFDVLSWKDKAESLLSRKEAPFEELDDLHKMLDMLVRGRSSSRMTTLTSIEPNASIDEEIQSFAKTDISTLSGSLTSIVKSKYSETKSWKERADSIINALEQHNSQQLSTQKPPPMVDLKRINSLLAEYNRLGIYLPNHYTLLVQECTKANLWSLELTNTLADTSKALSALIPYLQESKTNRPKGIIVDPARHVVDNLLDLLLWHHQVAEAQKQTSQSTLKQGSGQTDSKALYPLISEGSEILELFTSKSDRIRFAVSSAGAVALIAKQLDSRRPVRVISRNKLETNPLGKIILGRLISEDNKEGYPLSFLVYLLWRITMFDFVESYESRRGKKDGMTLKEAQTLILQKPIPEALDRRTSTSDFMADVDNVNANWGFNYSDKEKQLMQLIQEGESKEESALKALATAKELFRGPSRHAEEICEHIVKVKDLLHQFKSIRTEGTGLFLSRKLENNLEQNLKALTWVSRTFPYPFLHQVHYELTPENRMSWDTLINLNERKPSGLENMGDCAGIALRAAELYESAKAWQSEISKVTMLSNRGGKRRDGSLTDSEAGTQATVDVQKVHRLAKDPILAKVDMPREDAVTEILERVKAFETHLHKFLGEDYDGNNPDRAPYPDANSLVGDSGEFLLYRLTGSPLFTVLLSSIETIANTGQHLLADTPGKMAFEWIRRAVAWIESLRAAVTLKAYRAGSFVAERLVITESDARHILEDGKSFFLEIPDDLKKTLSFHYINVSTNKVDEKLTVVFKKGGAHHSVGGTAIRWCPVLFDSLREDIMRLEDWKDQVEVIQDEFEQCLTEKDGPLLEYDDEALSRLYNFYDETLLLLEEGVESLVVAPAKQLVDALSRLLDTVKVHLLENANDAIIEKIKKKRFEDSAAILKDRFELLDSLLSRGTIAYENEEPHTPTLRNLGILDGSFRDTCRLYFEKALRKGLQMMGFQDDDPDMNDIAFCVTKAWEIEFEMYNRFQVNCGDNIISPEYRDKARTIRWGLEDSSSPKLCLQVLLGEIEPAEFVNMSDEQILGNTHDNESSEAEEVEDVETQNDTGDADLSGIERQEQSITHAVDEIDPASGIKVGLGETAPDEGGNVDDRKRAPETSRSEVNLEDAVSDTAVSDTAKQLYAIAQSQQSAIESAVESQKTKDAVSNSKEESADSIYEDLDLAPATGSLSDKGGGGEKDEGSQQMVEVSSTRPDAPPSLAASVVYPSSGGIHKSSKKKSSGKASKRGKFVTNASGEESFQFSVCKPTVKFTARFYNENEAHASLCGILPDSISEKGRLRVDEFLKFLSGKLKGGRWVAIPMRLSIYSEEDAKKHKKFYKEYEANKRIAMFSIGENTKVFFVTPKFHRAAAKVIGSSFNVETSTYAVVLTKEKLSKGHSK